MVVVVAPLEMRSTSSDFGFRDCQHSFVMSRQPDVVRVTRGDAAGDGHDGGHTPLVPVPGAGPFGLPPPNTGVLRGAAGTRAVGGRSGA